jgi:hypothetical protein
MLKVKIELHPFGDVSKKKELASLNIWNDASGTREVGSYGYTIAEPESYFSEEVKGEGEVRDYDRMQPAVRLLYEVLKNYFEKSS